MIVTQVMDHLHQIVVPTPFAVGPVNCYVATTDPITLIDTGPRHDDSRAAITAGLRELGLAVSDIKRIIITHAHADHYGLAAELVRESKAELWTQRFNRATLEDFEHERQHRNAFYIQIMTESGVPSEERQRVAESRRVGDRFAEPVKVDHTLDEGDRVEMAGRAWQVYHTPGHAGGLIMVFDHDSRVLLSNDHLLRDISSNPIVEPAPGGGPRPHRLVEYLYHLHRAIDLHPSIAWTAHGEPVHDVAKLVRQRLAFHVRRAEKILDMIGAEERTAYQIAEPLFGRLKGIDSFLALSETIGHLDWLEEQGRVEAIQHDDVICWRQMQKPNGL